MKFLNMTSVKKDRLRKKSGKLCYGIVRLILCLGFAYTILYPLIMMISRAIMSVEDLYDNSVVWIPKSFSMETIKAIFELLDYPSALWNSLWIALAITIMQLITCMATGYGFARFKFPGRNILFGGVIFSLLVPPQLVIMPTYLNFKEFDIFGIIELIAGAPLNLLNTSLPMFLLAVTGNGIKCGLFIYIFRQTFINIPMETEEAATVDGAGAFKTFVQIMVPSARNAAITVGLFSFVWQWNDIFYSNIYLKEETLSMSYLGLGLGNIASINPDFAKYNFYNTTIKAAFEGTAVLLILLPLIIMFLALQRYFVDSVENSGLVG